MFTYLFGAGASAQQIPTVKAFGEKIKDYRKELISYPLPPERFEPPNHDIHYSQKQLSHKFFEGLEWLEFTISQHISFDTYAKLLYLSNKNPELKKLKSLIDLFLTGWQILKGVDPRYDLFFASILEGGQGRTVALPHKIKILSWNYDFQPELSINKIFGSDDLESVQSYLNCYVNGKKSKPLSLSEFSLIKLNGTSGFIDESSKYISHAFNIKKTAHELQDDDKRDLIRYLSLAYHLMNLPHGHHSGLTYSWESNAYSNALRESALKQSETTKYLIIIGYSFPTFNREIDRKILSSMINLDKIYIQDRPENIKNIHSRVKSLIEGRNNISVVLIDTTDEFYIPFEY